MTQLYTPALKVLKRCVTLKERSLPIPGDVLVKPGDRVQAETAVARANLPGAVELLSIALKLDIDPGDLKKHLLKGEGEEVEQGEIIARQQGLFGLFHSEFVSPVSGMIETISSATGKVTVRQKPIPIELNAYVDGTIDSLIPEKGVVVRTWGATIQGIFGSGKEAVGNLQCAAASPAEILTEEKLSKKFSGAVIVGGSGITQGALEKALRLGVKAVIVGALEAQELNERIPEKMPVIITEGFGVLPMAQRTFELLKSCEGRKTSVNGMTQIRAGVIRPEIIIPFLEETPSMQDNGEWSSLGLAIGSRVRIVQEPYFGALGQVVGLPSEPQTLATEARVRVAEVRLASGETCLVPRANLEVFED